jgi:hypothetical protein
VPSYVDSQIGTQKEQLSYTIAAGSTEVSIGVAAPTLSAGWLVEPKSPRSRAKLSAAKLPSVR